MEWTRKLKETDKYFSIVCPRCNSHKLASKNTRAVESGVRRRRICSVCNYRITTFESVIGDREPNVVVKYKQAFDKLNNAISECIRLFEKLGYL